MIDILQNNFIYIAIFGIIVVAAEQIASILTKYKLPLITGCLLVGIFTGPYMLKIISFTEIDSLNFIEEMALAFIAYIAGSELYIKEMKDRLTSIKWITISLVFFTFSIGASSIYLMAEYIPFMRDMSSLYKIGVSILAGTILVARSPSSAVAIINETRAQGPFTQTTLGVTVVMDVVVIIIFAFCSSITSAIFNDIDFNLTFAVVLTAEMVMSILLGILLGNFLEIIVKVKIAGQNIKFAIILLSGLSIYILTHFMQRLSIDLLHVNAHFEPLLICMIASFKVTNNHNVRDHYLQLLKQYSKHVYITFFTLTGISINITVLTQIWHIALAIFAIRIVSIFIGSFTGGILARGPMKHNKILWMAFITQAGIGIGLAEEVAVIFPEWGHNFSSLIVAVIILNQIIGPTVFKTALLLVKEARPKAKKSDPDSIHDVIILGDAGQAEILARQLHLHHWKVTLATNSKETTNSQTLDGITVETIGEINSEALKKLGGDKTGCVVTMLSDEDNYIAAQIIYEHFGNANIVVYLKDRANFEDFAKLDAFIVSASTAVISLLDHFVRSPSAVSLMLGIEEDKDMVDITIKNPNLVGMSLKDLRIPASILIISIHRKGKALHVHSDFRFKLRDHVTLAGVLEDIEEIEFRFESPSYV